jgi:8-oxo-dGTP pyrophosphatase MutT (NUDIX family)
MPRKKRKPVLKVRAVLVGPDGQAYGITSARKVRVLQLVGGGVKRSESLKEAILREIQEETGFRKVKLIKRVKGELHVTREDGTLEITTVFIARVSGRRRPTALTGRERSRRLELTEFEDLSSLQRALRKRERRHGRTALARDLELTRRARRAA